MERRPPTITLRTSGIAKDKDALTPSLFPSIKGGYEQENWGNPLQRFRWPLLSLLCLFLIVAVVFWHVPWSTRSLPDTHATTQTRLTQQSATATARAYHKMQASLAARAYAIGTITAAVGTGNLLYGDTLINSGSGWLDDGSQCFFSPEGYHVYSHMIHATAWCYSGQQQFSDVVVSAQAQLLHGDVYGLLFRLDPVDKTFYALEINQHGDYRFVRAQGSNVLDWLTLIDWTHSSAIHSGYAQTNTFMVVAIGPHFRFYINKQLIVTTFQDAAYPTGCIGFLVGGDSSGGTEAIFRNALVFQK
jgi:hypothetical protein